MTGMPETRRRSSSRRRWSRGRDQSVRRPTNPPRVGALPKDNALVGRSSGPPRRIERRVAMASKNANWRPVEELYPQIDETIQTARHNDSSGGHALPEQLVGALAVRIGR